MNLLKDASMYIGPGLVLEGLLLVGYKLKLQKGKKKVSGLFWVVEVIFAIYMTIIFAATVSPMYGFSIHPDFSDVNLRPFEVLSDWKANPLNFYGNILMFIPFGLLTSLLSRRQQHALRNILFGSLISLFIEVCQLFLGRGSDVDDLILNTIGTCLGYLIAMMILCLCPALRYYTGIQLKSGKRYLRNDAGSLKMTIVAMLFCVLVVGGRKHMLYMQEDLLTPLPVKDENTIEKTVEQTPKATQTMNQDGIVRELGNLDLEAANICVYSGISGEILLGKDEKQKIAPASTTKMLTALVALKYLKLDEQVTVGSEINEVASDASVAGLYKGQIADVESLLYGLLLPSGNDAAYVLANYAGRKIAGNFDVTTEEAITCFVDQMNQMANEIGAENSNFVRPDGYDDSNQYTTAYDLTVIASQLLKEDCLKEIVGQQSKRCIFPDGTDVTYQNTNEMLNPQSAYYRQNVFGIKTGSSQNAGKCVVTAISTEYGDLICAVMGDSEEGRWLDCDKIFDAAIK